MSSLEGGSSMRSQVNKADFFFSRRRRHTRYSGDWSSDVCSSDLAGSSWRTTAYSIRCQTRRSHLLGQDRKSVVEGKSVDLGGRRIIKKKKNVMRGHVLVYAREHKRVGRALREGCLT